MKKLSSSQSQSLLTLSTLIAMYSAGAKRSLGWDQESQESQDQKEVKIGRMCTLW